MAFQDFWMNVRKAARFIPSRAVLDSPSLDAETIEHGLRGGLSWLCPQTVAGFEEADFAFLPAPDRTRLAERVRRFEEISRSGVPPQSFEPNSAAVDEAVPLLREIIEILGFDHYGDAEAFRLGKKIERELEPSRPLELLALQFKTGEDHTGDPGIWIRAILTDDSSRTDEGFLENAERIRGLLDAVARRAAPERWPYLSFRSREEQAELAETP